MHSMLHIFGLLHLTSLTSSLWTAPGLASNGAPALVRGGGNVAATAAALLCQLCRGMRERWVFSCLNVVKVAMVRDRTIVSDKAGGG